MDKGIVEGGEDVGDSEDKFAFPDLRAEGGDLFFLRDLFLWWLFTYMLARQLKGVSEVGEPYHC